MPRPARKIGTTATFFPANVFATHFATGVSISISFVGKSLVTS